MKVGDYAVLRAIPRLLAIVQIPKVASFNVGQNRHQPTDPRLPAHLAPSREESCDVPTRCREQRLGDLMEVVGAVPWGLHANTSEPPCSGVPGCPRRSWRGDDQRRNDNGFIFGGPGL